MKGYRLFSLYVLFVNMTCLVHTKTYKTKVDMCDRKRDKQKILLKVPPFTKSRSSELLENNKQYLKDLKFILHEETNKYEDVTGPHWLIIKNIGLRDFYLTKSDIKKIRLPRKKKVRILHEVQYLLTSMLYHIKIANIMEKGYQFKKLTRKIHLAGKMWGNFMKSLNVVTKRRKASCYRKGPIPKGLSTREIAKHSMIMLRDFSCSIDKILSNLEQCRVKQRIKKTNGKKRLILKMNCGKRAKSIFNSKPKKGRSQSSKYAHHKCLAPNKLYRLSEL